MTRQAGKLLKTKELSIESLPVFDENDSADGSSWTLLVQGRVMDTHQMWKVTTSDGIVRWLPRRRWYDAVIRSARKGIVRDLYTTQDYVRLVWGYVLDKIVVAYTPPRGEENRWGSIETDEFKSEEEKVAEWVRSVETRIR